MLFVGGKVLAKFLQRPAQVGKVAIFRSGRASPNTRVFAAQQKSVEHLSSRLHDVHKAAPSANPCLEPSDACFSCSTLLTRSFRRQSLAAGTRSLQLHTASTRSLF